jgi:hypothetical protein
LKPRDGVVSSTAGVVDLSNRATTLAATYEDRTRPAELLERVGRGLLQIRTADSEVVAVPEKAVTVACREPQ